MLNIKHAMKDALCTTKELLTGTTATTNQKIALGVVGGLLLVTTICSGMCKNSKECSCDCNDANPEDLDDEFIEDEIFDEEEDTDEDDDFDMEDMEGEYIDGSVENIVNGETDNDEDDNEEEGDDINDSNENVEKDETKEEGGETKEPENEDDEEELSMDYVPVIRKKQVGFWTVGKLFKLQENATKEGMDIRTLCNIMQTRKRNIEKGLNILHDRKQLPDDFTIPYDKRNLKKGENNDAVDNCKESEEANS